MLSHLTRASGKKVPRCQEPHVAAQGGWRFYQCERAAITGSQFCRQHDPDQIKKRDEIRHQKHDAEWQTRRVELNGHRFMATLQLIADGHNNPRLLACETLENFNSKK